jgi:hypothetical protein
VPEKAKANQLNPSLYTNFTGWIAPQLGQLRAEL